MRLRGTLAVRIVAPIIGATILTLLIGILSVHAHAIIDGLVIDFTNTPTGLAASSSPWLQYLGIAVLVAASVFFVWPGASTPDRPRSVLTAITMGGVLFVFSAWFLATSGVAAVGQVSATSAAAPGSAASFYGRIARDPAILTWLRFGALNPAVHAVIAFCFVVPFITRPRRRTGSRDDGLVPHEPA